MITLKDLIMVLDANTPVKIYYDPPQPYRNINKKRFGDLLMIEVGKMLDIEVTSMEITDGVFNIYLGDMEYDQD